MPWGLVPRGAFVEIVRTIFLFCSVAWLLLNHAAESPAFENSLKEFARNVASARARNDAAWMLNQLPSSRIPHDVLESYTDRLRRFFADRKLVLADVKLFRFPDYRPDSPSPGTFAGRKLKYLTQPTHWVVVETATPSPPSGSPSASGNSTSASAKMECPVAQVGGRWQIVGWKFAD